MNVSRQNKLNFGDPLFDSLCFGLRPFVVLLEVVGEIAIQVETSCIISEKYLRYYLRYLRIGALISFRISHTFLGGLQHVYIFDDFLKISISGVSTKYYYCKT